MSDEEHVDFESYFATVKFDRESSLAKTIVPVQQLPSVAHVLETLPQIQTETTQSSLSSELEMEGKLGEGGMGVVYLARQRALERMVAVKSSRGDAPNSVDSLLQEAYITGMLEHPNIIPVYNLGKNEKGSPLIVMKRIEGTCWLDVLNDPSLAPEGEQIDLTWHLQLLIKVCDAVRFAHNKGVIHRDIKPENVMIGSFGESYLLDWGISVGLDDDHPSIQPRTQSKGIAGTPAYMAPEMTMDTAVDVDERTDVYLLGATLHQIITGELRHTGDSFMAVLSNVMKSAPFEYDASVPGELAKVANKATARDPDERYQTAQEFQTAIEEYLEHRASVEIAAEAGFRLKELEIVLGRELSEESQEKLHNLYGECRFGLQQSIKLWPQNAAAIESLQHCLELMVRHYIDIGNALGAAVVLNELVKPNPDLSVEVETLLNLHAAEQEEMESLKRLRSAVDLKLGRGARSLLLLFLGLAWALTSVYGGWVGLQDGFTEADRMARHIRAIPRVFGVGTIAIFIFRKRLFSNQINARINYTLLFSFVLLTCARLYALSFGVKVADAVAFECFIYAMATVAGGVLSDIRIAWVGVGVFGSIAFLGRVNPDHQLFWLSGGLMVVFAAIAWIWRDAEV